MQMVGCNPSTNPETSKGSFLFIHSVPPSSISQRQCKLGCSYRSLIHPGNNNTQANAAPLCEAPMQNPEIDAGHRDQDRTQTSAMPAAMLEGEKPIQQHYKESQTSQEEKERKSILHPLCVFLNDGLPLQATSSSSSAFVLHAAAEKPCPTLPLTTRHLSLSYS